MTKRPIEPEQRKPEVRVQFECPLRLGDGVVVAAGPIQCADQIRVDDQRKRIEIARPFLFPDGFIVSPAQRQVAAMPVPTQRVVRVELEGAVKLSLGIPPVPVVPGVSGCQGVVGARESVIQFEGLGRRGLSASQGFLGRYRIIGARDEVGVCETGIC